MGTSYSLRLVVGFEISKKEVLLPFQRSHIEKEDGVFHMEDRFDPKTGFKLDPIKVWDKKPKTNTEKWLEIDNQRYDDIDDCELCYVLSKYFSCNVENCGCYITGNLTFVFYVNKPINHRDAINNGNFTIYNNSIDIDNLNNLQPALDELYKKLKNNGYSVGKPRVFVAERVS